jgi:electron transfer flavoprotein alpha subunit
MADSKGVLVIGEILNGVLSSVSTEVLGCGRKLADELGEKLSALLIGSETGDAAKDAVAFGADKVYVVENALLAGYQSDAYAAAAEKAVKEIAPAIVITGQTSMGSDIAPRLAYRLGTAVLMDCIQLEIDKDSKRMLQTKPVYGGNAQAVYVTDTDPQIATVRAKSMTPLAKDASRTGEVVKIDAGIDESVMKTKVIDKVTEEIQGIKLEDASIIVSGGRGIGGPEGFSQLEQLAKVLRGAVGASRPACDNGWMPEKAQVGLTGKIVTPDLYIAIGISGASQHMAGCSGAKSIVALNKDADANIFRFAHYGVVGDWKKLLPALTEKVKELTA